MKLEDLKAIGCNRIEYMEIRPAYFVAIPFPDSADSTWQKAIQDKTNPGLGALCYYALRNPDLAMARSRLLNRSKYPQGTGHTPEEARYDLIRLLEKVTPADEDAFRLGMAAMLAAWISITVVYEVNRKSGGTFMQEPLLNALEENTPKTFEMTPYLRYLEEWLEGSAGPAIGDHVLDNSASDEGPAADVVTLDALANILDFRVVSYKNDTGWESILVPTMSAEKLEKYFGLGLDEVGIEESMKADTWKGYATRCFLRAQYYPWSAGSTLLDSLGGIAEKMYSLPLSVVSDYAALITQTSNNWLLTLRMLKSEYLIDGQLDQDEINGELKHTLAVDAARLHQWFSVLVNANYDKNKDQA